MCHLVFHRKERFQLSDMGHMQTSRRVRVMSSLPKADIRQRE